MCMFAGTIFTVIISLENIISNDCPESVAIPISPQEKNNNYGHSLKLLYFRITVK